MWGARVEWKRASRAVAGCLLVAGAAEAGDLKLEGLLEARTIEVEGQKSWLKGGFSRLTEGAEGPEQRAWAARGQVHLGLDWRPSPLWLVTAHGALELEPSSDRGQKAGLVEAFAQFRPELTPALALRFRAGIVFPETSLENQDPLWQSPYTLTLSALNSWAAEELRLTGLETALQWKLSKDASLAVAGNLFVANDAAGALVAWRGWSFSDRLTTVGEVLPLPPLRTLQAGGAFGSQENGTRPLSELDGRPGFEIRGRLAEGTLVEARVARYDNRGDRELYSGQYSWDTAFSTAGLALHPAPGWTVLGEGALGRTGMGPEAPSRPHVDVRFRVGYLLVSWASERWRVSGRLDSFTNHDLDQTAEPDQESGWSWTVALFFRPRKPLRLGAEVLSVRAERPAAADSGANPNTNAWRAQIEARTTF